MTSLTVIGCGYLGAVHAACMAHLGHDVVGIDTGITMIMAENARTGYVWKVFMENPEAQRGMERAGFKPYQPAPVTPAMLTSAIGSSR